MAPINAIFEQTFTANVAVVGIVETIVATLQGVATPTADRPVRLQGWVQLTPGADQTSAALAIRRTDAAGALVGEQNARTFAAAANQVFDLQVIGVDNPGAVAGQVYVLTVLQAGGVANGSALQGALLALI